LRHWESFIATYSRHLRHFSQHRSEPHLFVQVSLRKLTDESSRQFLQKKKEKDPLMEYLLNFRERMDHAKTLLTDGAKTAFFFIALPEALPIAVIKRFIAWFHDFGIPVGGVVVNMLIDEAMVGDDAPEFVVNRVAMQADYMDEIWRSFPDVRAVVPLFETEIRGSDMLARTADVMFA
jgi:arsenite-transporting ATPase